MENQTELIPYQKCGVRHNHNLTLYDSDWALPMEFLLEWICPAPQMELN